MVHQAGAARALADGGDDAHGQVPPGWGRGAEVATLWARYSELLVTSQADNCTILLFDVG